MTLVTAHFDLDLAKLPIKSDLLSARFDRKPNAKGHLMLLMYPNGTAATEPRYVRYATGMRLASADRTKDGAQTQAGRMGQLIVTAERLLGMFVQGNVGGKVVDDSKGSIYTFACSRDDIASAEIKTNWRGKSVEAFVNSKPGQDVPFRLYLFSVVAALKDDGGYSYADLPRLLERLTPQGREQLRVQTDA